MAVDAYLQIEGIKGESQDSAHKDWIECLNVHFEVDQPRSPVTSTSGGHTSARADFDDVVVAKLADLSTPLLLQQVFQREHGCAQFACARKSPWIGCNRAGQHFEHARLY